MNARAVVRKRPVVLTFLNQKGGTGKTTITQNLALCLGLHHRKKVLCIDLDPQGSLTFGLTTQPFSSNRTADRLLVVPQASIPDYILSCRHNLDLIPNRFQRQLRETVDRLPASRGLLRRQLGAHLAQYDYVLIDTPAGLSNSTRIGTEAADQIIIAISCGFYALKGTSGVVDWVSEICQQGGEKWPEVNFVLNNYDGRRRFDREFNQEAEYIFGDALLRTRIRSSVKVSEAAARSQSIVEYAPENPVAMDFLNLSREILGLPLIENIPALSERDEEVLPEPRLKLVS